MGTTEKLIAISQSGPRGENLDTDEPLGTEIEKEV